LLECVINISEGRDPSVIADLGKAAGNSLLDTHSDRFHNRSVFTLYGKNVYQDASALAEKAFELLDLTQHEGVHPRIGILDVVPFVPIGNTDISEALEARQRFGLEISAKFLVPVFLYGPNRSLPYVRREAFKTLKPDFGPSAPHPRYGAVAVGARELLVAYNLYLTRPDLDEARLIAQEVRSHCFRTLGLKVGNEVQISANLVDPLNHGIYEFYKAVSRLTPISRGELVGLAPLKTIEETPGHLWETLDLEIDKALEIRTSAKETGPSI